MAELHEDLIEEIEETAREQILTGYATLDDVAETVVEVHQLAEDEQDQARLIVDRIWAERIAEQQSWPELTDVDRLVSAFDALESKGIVARGNFSCCGNCGAGEILDEAGEDSRGYVFFHQQDTESATYNKGLYLSYGSLDGTLADSVAVGHEVVAALGEGGLSTVWDGTIEKRILVKLVWQKRLPV